MTAKKQSPENTSSLVVKAEYTKTDVDRYHGNPLIEALPALARDLREFDSFIENIPPKPTDKTRRKSEVVRFMETMTIKDFIYPFPEYSKASRAIANLMRESYVSRNPMTAIDVQRRHALVTKDSHAFPHDWTSSANGYLMVAVTGIGKSTWAKAFLVRLPQLIRHEQYQGRLVPTRHQIVYIYLRIPYNGTLSALCLQFFRKVDALLGTNYLREAKALRSIAPMVELMSHVASAVSLSFIVVDELQNLRSARDENADIALNYLCEIIEGVGVSVISIGTPAIHSVLVRSVASTRKLTSSSGLVIQPMRKGDLQWKTFCELCWDYTYVKNKPRLDDETMNVWHDISAGNTAFAISAFLLTQRNEIGGREIVDIEGLRRTAAVDMAFLQPAIAALNSGKPERLRLFDDLMYGARYKALQRLLGIDDELTDEDMNAHSSEFDEVEHAITQREKRKERRRQAKKQTYDDWTDDLPTIDPLIS
jgi:hypothetical protein